MIYLSGKIANDDPEVKKKNLERFFEVEKLLKERDVCYNPARLEPKHPDWTYEQLLIECLCTMWLELPEMYFMKDWQDSRGARLEHELAQRLGLYIEYEEATD